MPFNLCSCETYREMRKVPDLAHFWFPADTKDLTRASLLLYLVSEIPLIRIIVALKPAQSLKIDTLDKSQIALL